MAPRPIPKPPLLIESESESPLRELIVKAAFAPGGLSRETFKKQERERERELAQMR
jgi:hypothetical protein